MTLSIGAYRVLSVALLLVTSVTLLTPGETVQALEGWLRQWWPWLPSGDDKPGLPIDKLVHMGLFALCGWSLVHGWYSAMRSWVPLLGGLVVFGLATEIAQHFIPGRGADVYDWVADVLGAALGVGVAVVARRM